MKKSSRSGVRETTRQEIVLGTRRSELALVQTRMVKEALARTRPSLKVGTKIIRTRGDETVMPSRAGGSSRESFTITSTGSLGFAPDDRAKGRKGIFTTELERALMKKRIDAAEHSAQDLASEIEGALIIAAV